jgi:hypothetical protein
LSVWDWEPDNHNCELEQLYHEYVAALKKATARFTETGWWRPLPDETVEATIEEAASKAADTSDEGEKDGLMCPRDNNLVSSADNEVFPCLH